MKLRQFYIFDHFQKPQNFVTIYTANVVKVTQTLGG